MISPVKMGVAESQVGCHHRKGCARSRPGGGVKWTSFVLKFFVGMIKPMDQLINTVRLNFEEKMFF